VVLAAVVAASMVRRVEQATLAASAARATMADREVVSRRLKAAAAAVWAARVPMLRAALAVMVVRLVRTLTLTERRAAQVSVRGLAAAAVATTLVQTKATVVARVQVGLVWLVRPTQVLAVAVALQATMLPQVDREPS
tara:strand:+ start:452 stop:865 length:414 start_codon:yes stop_codon:yes gene_type:complete